MRGYDDVFQAWFLCEEHDLASDDEMERQLGPEAASIALRFS
jgi:hypothetical protein